MNIIDKLTKPDYYKRHIENSKEGIRKIHEVIDIIDDGYNGPAINLLIQASNELLTNMDFKERLDIIDECRSMLDKYEM